MLSRALRGAPRPVNGYVCCSCLIQSQYTVQPRSYTSAATPAQDEASTGPAIIKKKGTSRLPHRRRIRKIGSSSKDGVRSATVQSGKPALPRKIVSKVVSKGQDEGISRANDGLKRVTSKGKPKAAFRRIVGPTSADQTADSQPSGFAAGAATTIAKDPDLGAQSIVDPQQPAEAAPKPEKNSPPQKKTSKSATSTMSSKKPTKRLSASARRVPSRKSKDSDEEADFPRKIIETTKVESLEITAVTVQKQPTVPGLSYGLDRVLFNPGVYQLQDPRSRVYNFDPYLQNIMPIAEFDFTALKEYITSSRDTVLKEVAQAHQKRYSGSSSSMTSALAHFHFLISQWRPISTTMMSQGFLDKEKNRNFTVIQRGPSACFVKWKGGSYAIDADKQFDTANILSMLGKSMEKLLTLETEAFERYRLENSDQIGAEERESPEAFHYSTMGDFLMRSQLDAHDPRLPGTGMFDLKTRAVVSIRMDTENYQKGMGYEIKNLKGDFESYEREYYDMIRSAFLKYSLQVRMGRMDGIFVAFHNVERIFGFQYISLPEMDKALHGSSDVTLGDQEFKLSVDLLNKVLDRATARFPEQSLRLHFETRDTQTPFMYVFAEPVTEEQMDEIQGTNVEKIAEFEKKVLGLHKEDPNESEGPATWEDLHADVERELEQDEHTKSEAPGALGDEQEDVQESQDHKIECKEQPSTPNDRHAMTEQNATSTIGISLSESLKAARFHQAESEAHGDKATNRQSDQPNDSAENEQEDVELQDTSLENDMIESRHHGDKDWIDGIEQEHSDVASEDTNEVLAMTLTIRNKINGRYVTRPGDLSLQDRWAIEYSLADVPGADRAWSLYRACQTRRKKVLVSAEEKENEYLRRLRAMSVAGRSWRKHQDKKDKALGTRIYGAPRSSATETLTDSSEGSPLQEE